MSRRPLASLRALTTVVVGALALVLAIASSASLARAGPPDAEEVADERVLIRVVPRNEQISARLRAELGLLGLLAEPLAVAEDEPTLGPELLDRIADEGDASAAIEIVVTDERIDVWVADANTGKTLNRRLDLALDPEQDDPRTLAIAAVELLRASRLELAEDPSSEPVDDEQPGERGPDQATENERPPGAVDLPSEGAISIAPMVGGSPGGFGVMTHVELAGRWVPRDRFALRFSAWIPTLGSSIGTEFGNPRLFVGNLFVEPQVLLPGGARWFHPELGLGLGGAVLGIVGNATEEFTDVTVIRGGFASYAHVGFGFAVTRRLWVRLDGYVGMLLPRLRVQVMFEPVATWGWPFASGTLGLEIWL